MAKLWSVLDFLLKNPSKLKKIFVEGGVLTPKSPPGYAPTLNHPKTKENKNNK